MILGGLSFFSPSRVANASSQKGEEMAWAGTVYVALAALFWGLSGGIGGVLMASGWDPFVVSFYRGAIGLLFVLVWLGLRPQGSGLGNRRVWFWSVVAGCGVAGNFSFYFVSIAQSSLAVAVMLMYCAPVFVSLISFALKLERPTPLKWGAVALVMVGILLLTRVYDFGFTGVTLIGVAAGLLAGLSYAVFIFGFKSAAPHGSPQAILSIAFTALVILLIGPSDASQLVAVMHTPDWPLFAGLGVLGAGLSFVLYIIGLNQTTPTMASIVAMVEPVTASLLGVILFNEKLVGSQIFGMGLILITVTVLSAHLSLRRPSSDSTTR
ncbi:MAG: EamA family transporter [Desulfuromonadales bacterium]